MPFYGACCIENRFVKALDCFAFLTEYPLRLGIDTVLFKFVDRILK